MAKGKPSSTNTSANLGFEAMLTTMGHDIGDAVFVPECDSLRRNSHLLEKGSFGESTDAAVSIGVEGNANCAEAPSTGDVRTASPSATSGTTSAKRMQANAAPLPPCATRFCRSCRAGS